MEAASRAADITGVSAYTIRKWATQYYFSMIDVTPDTIDHDMFDLLSSDRVRSSKTVDSLHK